MLGTRTRNAALAVLGLLACLALLGPAVGSAKKPKKPKNCGHLYQPHCRKPLAKTYRASDRTENSAVVNGHVNPFGQDTTYYFQYGRSTNFGNHTDTHHTTTAQNVSATLTQLDPGTRYYYRLVASNPNGTSHGATRHFSTRKQKH